ncbi:ABC transporter permease [Paenalkalicoccus suaedae]|uniref:ABC transporter permease n=1 Tax=Paenalkalicoccus suaedae TaxID=2592382 RepID=A0A859FBZ5_9BACI|nr:ABC transporter permease [Paenalkalicoccus suaedae]QKS70348.1 ABC transporter permease [Paenalkalicoccus suaedae]
MRAVLYHYVRMVIRRPLTFFGSMVLAIVFAAVIGGGGDTSTIPVASEELSEEELATIATEIENFSDENIELLPTTMQSLEDRVRRSSPPFGIVLNEADASVLKVYDAPEIVLFTSELQAFYREKGYEVAVEAFVEADEWSERLEEAAGFTYEMETTESVFAYDRALHAIFGFMLFFTINTVVFSISSIVVQRQEGTWDRMILSAVSKAELYLGHVLFAFGFGVLNMYIILFLFQFVFQVDFYGGFWLTLLVVLPYILAVVSLGILISGIVTSYKMLDAVIPLVSVSMAMLGGAFWPLEVVSMEFLQQVASFIPLKHGMDLLIGVTYGSMQTEDMLLSTSVLVLMSVVFAGIGFNLMERR